MVHGGVASSVKGELTGEGGNHIFPHQCAGRKNWAARNHVLWGPLRNLAGL